jgi:alanine racemase
VELCLFSDDAVARVGGAVRAAGRPARVHAYLDTGMSRMGMPYHRAVPWFAALAQGGIRPTSTFTELTEDAEFDREQVRRLQEVARELRGQGIDPGPLHAGSSHAVFNYPDGCLDMARPGISLFGAYPTDAGSEREIAELRPAFRLRARVVRVERLRAGDSVSYGRAYTAERPTWVATLPVGHSDGYPREAVEGAHVLLNGRLYPPVGAVSASHTVVELGEQDPAVAIGDVATLVGPDRPEIHPNALASRIGRSVYDVLMHLHAGLPRVSV